MQTESSVIANLAEIMQLEHERVSAERAAEHAARAAVERAQQEHAERQRRHAQRVERVQARLRARAERRVERQAREREAALLRVRLDAEARVRLQREAQAAAGSVQLQAPTRTLARAWQHGAWLLAVALIGAGSLVQLRGSATELAAARAAERAAEREAQAQAAAAAQDRARMQAELQALRSAAGDASDRVSGPAQAAATQTLRPIGKTASQLTRPRPNVGTASGTSPAPQHSGPLDEIDETDEDPLGGLFDPRPTPRRRAPRR